MIDGGFPIYVLDDESVFFIKEDLDHPSYWESFVAKEFAKKYKVNFHNIKNLPYSQKRARIVGNKLYCGEKLSKKLIKKIEKSVGFSLKYIYDEHETRSEIEVCQLKTHVNNHIVISTI